VSLILSGDVSEHPGSDVTLEEMKAMVLSFCLVHQGAVFTRSSKSLKVSWTCSLNVLVLLSNMETEL
jgi:hypothetical protein